MQHVAFAVKDVDQTIRALETKGGKWVLGEANNPFGYVDLRDQLGFTVEVGRQQAPATAPAAPAR